MTNLTTIPLVGTVIVKAEVIARRTGGAAGAAEDSAGYGRVATYKNSATQVGATTALWTHEDQAGWDCDLDASGGTARVRVTGAASNNITWRGKASYLSVV